MSERNPSIELLRCILMFGICLLHTIGKGPWYIEYTSLSLWLMTCVSGFVFISGYYGIQFSISKAFRLYGVSIGAGLSVLLFGKYYYNLEYTSKDIFQIIWGQWYLNAYFFLMLLTPLINTALHSFHGGKQIKILVPLVILLFWSFLIERPFFRDILPKTSGLGSYTVTTLLLTYIAARLTREHKFLQNTSTYTLLLMGITTSLVISLFRMGYYSSPFSMFLAIVYFRLFERLSFPLWIRKVVLHMAPSMFAILIIHDNQIGTRYIHQIFHFFPLPIWGKIICTAIALFFSCLMLDIPRRLFVRLFSKQINILLNYPDKLLTEILDTQKT